MSKSERPDRALDEESNLSPAQDRADGRVEYTCTVCGRTSDSQWAVLKCECVHTVADLRDTLARLIGR